MHSVQLVGIFLHQDSNRKVYQVENMMFVAMPLILHAIYESRTREQNRLHTPTSKSSTSIVVCEFCAGSGFVALPLSFLFPEVTFVLIDLKEASLDIARQRIHCAEIELGIKIENVRIVRGRIEDFNEPFHVGIALHACGFASDIVLQKCIMSRAAFVICSCCIGKILLKTKLPHCFEYQSHLTEELYCKLVKAADFGHPDANSYAPVDKDRRYCKCLVEEDRRLFAQTANYGTAMLLMHPREASPKNDMLIGWPQDASSVFVDFSVDILQTSRGDEHSGDGLPTDIGQCHSCQCIQRAVNNCTVVNKLPDCVDDAFAAEMKSLNGNQRRLLALRYICPTNCVSSYAWKEENSCVRSHGQLILRSAHENLNAGNNKDCLMSYLFNV